MGKKQSKPETQLLLPFDFWEEEKKAAQKQYEARVNGLKFYASPKNENQLLFNLQKAHYQGDRKALGSMFVILSELSGKLINIELRKRKNLKFTHEKINELAIDAAAMVVEQFQKNHLMVETSFIAYLRLQVLKVMFRQSKSEKFERFCIRNGINIFSLDEGQKFQLKTRFEAMA